MAKKISIGLGVLDQSANAARSDGTGVRVFSGSFYDAGSEIGLDTLVQVYPAQTDSGKVVLSQGSAPAFHSTLFEDFRLRSTAVYNYYTADEQTTFLTDASASLEDLPRYVLLTWNMTPVRRVLTPTTKGVKQVDPRMQVGPEAVLSVGIAKDSVSNGYVSPGAIRALLVPPRDDVPAAAFDQDVFLASPSAAGRTAVEHLGNDRFHAAQILSEKTRTRVSFIDPSIAGALDPGRVEVSTDHAHLATLGSFSKLAAGLEVISEFNQDVPVRNTPPKFPAPAQTPGLMYIGYVIERYTLDAGGSMTLTRTIDIDSPDQGQFVDREVVFGGRYVYRIRTVVQWTRPSNYGFTGISTLDRNPTIDTSTSSPTRQASFYSGDWSDWARAEVIDDLLPDPPDEIIVRPVSHRGQIHINWKMPGDPQRDISAIRLLRSVVVDGRYGDWVQLGEYVPSNGMYIDTNVVPWEQGHTSYMYAMYSVSFHGEHSVLSERIEARLTDRSRYLGEEPVRQVGIKGDQPFAHARGPNEPPDLELTASRRLAVYIRGGSSGLPLFDRPYVIEVQSLATGERAEVGLDVDTTDVGMATSGARRSPKY